MPHPPTGDDAPATGDEVSLVTVTGPLTEAQAASVLSLAEAATERDWVGPLSEHVLLHVRYGGDARAREPAADGRPPAGWLRSPGSGDPDEGPAAELVIHPDYRGRGLGLDPGPRAAGRGGPAAAAGVGARRPARGRALADRAGFARIRSLWTMRRPLADPLPDPVFPPGSPCARFRVGADEAAWLDVNRRAFASHPEQGAWTAEDLSPARTRVLVRPGRVLPGRAGRETGGLPLDQGPHRQNENPAGSVMPRGSIGEVYVVGVDPGRAGQRAGPRADPGRAALPALPGAARGHALRGRGQHAGHPAVRVTGFRPPGHRRDVPASAGELSGQRAGRPASARAVRP